MYPLYIWVSGQNKYLLKYTFIDEINDIILILILIFDRLWHCEVQVHYSAWMGDVRVSRRPPGRILRGICDFNKKIGRIFILLAHGAPVKTIQWLPIPRREGSGWQELATGRKVFSLQSDICPRLCHQTRCAGNDDPEGEVRITAIGATVTHPPVINPKMVLPRLRMRQSAGMIEAEEPREEATGALDMENTEVAVLDRPCKR